MTFKILIVDDEAHARTNLRLALAPLAEWEVAGECPSAASARDFLQANEVDLILLDVQMPQESGLEMARSLSQRELPPLIVFATAHRGHALDAFDVHALDYIVKPVSEPRLHQAIARAQVLLEQRATYARALRQFTDPAPGFWSELIVRSVGRMDRVALKDVRWIETAGNYVELHLAHHTLMHRTTLTELVKYLDPDEFLRIHRRILVRRDQVLGLRQIQERTDVVALRCGHQLPISESYWAAVKSALSGRNVAPP
ncbi:LytR/AlgR family response regulator transcription factor [Duganella vulcania]|uniref:Response regulator n=1 Tax=Duganella vulcania TaxID=2692166 RepID=A0A845GVB7_9BURK|nr:LytTR family DNA-binding domain-containing protein [Duganella vulcania]MYM97775.1 response regulator [Duganella vulcania]